MRLLFGGKTSANMGRQFGMQTGRESYGRSGPSMRQADNGTFTKFVADTHSRAKVRVCPFCGSTQIDKQRTCVQCKTTVPGPTKRVR